MFNTIYKNIDPVATIVHQADTIRKMFANTKERRKMLFAEQKKLQMPQRAFPGPTPTYWWSLHIVLELLLANHQPISNCFADKSKFKRDEVFDFSIKFLTILWSLDHLGS